MSYELKFPLISKIGWNAVDQLKEEVDALQVKTILLVSDEVLLQIDHVKKVIDILEKSYKVVIYSDVEAEPSLDCAQAIVDFIKKRKVDCVIGIGGGSILDIAKLAAVLSQHDGSVKEYLNLTGNKKITEKGLPKILIPTTSGTGSEVTNISVLSLPGTKDVVVHNNMIADIAIVDPKLTVSVPPRITASTGADALTHAVEAYLSNQANMVTDALAEKAMSLIGGSLEDAVKDGKNTKARTMVSEGSFLAGLSFFHAGVAGVHALAYPLGGKFKLAHGESNAVLLPYVISYISESCPEKMNKVAQLLDADYTKEKIYTSTDFLQLFKKITAKIELPMCLRDYGIKESDLKGLTEDAMKQSRLLARSPMTLEQEDVYTIYKNAWQGVEQI